MVPPNAVPPREQTSMPNLESSYYRTTDHHSSSGDNFDRRDLFEKATDYTKALTHRATDPHGWQQWFHDESEKFIGIGQGLNEAKEQTKHAAVKAVTSLTDGTAWHQIQYHATHLDAEAVQLTTAAAPVFSAIVLDPCFFSKLAPSVAMSISQASDAYSRLSPRSQGRIIGEAMFACVNPEGNTESAEAALRVSTNISEHIDAHLIAGIQLSKQTLGRLRETGPNFARNAKQIFEDYIAAMGSLNSERLRYAGFPSDFFARATTPTAIERGCLAMVGRGGKSSRLHREGFPSRGDFSWVVSDETFADNAIRQTYDKSCVAAVGAMLSEGNFSEATFLSALSRYIRRPELGCSIQLMADVLGGNWTYMKEPDIYALSKTGCWAAELLHNAHYPQLGQELHAVMIETIRGGRIRVVDPWEATRYWMTEHEFQRHWTGKAVASIKVK